MSASALIAELAEERARFAEVVKERDSAIRRADACEQLIRARDMLLKDVATALGVDLSEHGDGAGMLPLLVRRGLEGLAEQCDAATAEAAGLREAAEIAKPQLRSGAQCARSEGYDEIELDIEKAIDAIDAALTRSGPGADLLARLKALEASDKELRAAASDVLSSLGPTQGKLWDACARLARATTCALPPAARPETGGAKP